MSARASPSVLPEALEQAVEGWAQQIILNRSHVIRPEVVEQLELRLREVNPGVVFHRPVQGRAMHEGERDAVLTMEGFASEAQWQARQRSRPMWLEQAAATVPRLRSPPS